MKILFLTNYYPPVSWGGYEQWCQEVADGLRNRGHRIEVLTSRYNIDSEKKIDPAWVHRTLYLEMEINSLRNGLIFFTTRKVRQDKNLQEIRRIIESINPDAVLIWGMWNLSRKIPALAEQLRPGKVAYYFGDYWPFLPPQDQTYWTVPARSWRTSLPKKILRPLAIRILAGEEQPKLSFANAIFASNFLRNEYFRKGLKTEKSSIIYGAIDTQPYIHLDTAPARGNEVSSLLYVGRITPDKGVHTCIQAMGFLRKQGIDIRFLIVGSGDREYITYLHDLARVEKVDDRILFLGAQPKSSLPGIYQMADILIFPSIWDEPFGRVIVEAMAAGVPVIGTSVGGAAEILDDGENALVFTPGSCESLANQILRLINTPELRLELAESARKTALERFDIQRMVVEIEAYLQVLVGG